MKSTILSLGLIITLHLSAMGQIDTLNLVEINSLVVPAANSSAFTANIDNDSTEEIIVCCNSNIYLYDYPELNLRWTSPASNWNNKLVSYDFNRDGHLDIGVADTSVKIFDISNNQLLWTSPRIDAYRGFSYDFGDLDGDSINDAVIVRLGTSAAHDSMNIDLYYGPQMQLSGHYAFIPRNIAGAEALSGTEVARLSGSLGIRPKIILFSTVGNSYFTWNPPDEWCSLQASWGKIYLIDPSDYGTIMIDTTGYDIYRSYSTDDSSNAYLYSIAKSNSDQSGTICHNFTYRNISQWTISADTIIKTRGLFYNSMWDPRYRDWKYFAVGDINYSHAGDEICYGLYDTLFLYTYPDFTLLWRDTINTDPGALNCVYHDNTLFSDPVILIPPYVINGSNGQIASRLRQYSLPTWTAIKDLNSDGIDELFLFSGQTLHFYHLQLVPSGIAENDPLPAIYRLYSNYPNPFNPNTTIQFNLPKASYVSLDIYDILGRKIETLVDSKQEAGIHSVLWNGSNKPSGLYFYRLKAGDFTETRKMLLLK